MIDDYKHVKSVGTRWYAFVGVGGTGKSTLATNVFYYFDPTMKLENTQMDTLGFVKALKIFKRVGAMNSCFLDEPDDIMSSMSKQAKYFRSVLGKARQQQMFLGICATDLFDIPPAIFRKLDGIFFLPYLGKYMFFKNKPKKFSYVIQDIRRFYNKFGYKIFFNMRKNVGYLGGDTHKAIPYDKETLQKYLEMKENDYDKTLGQFIKFYEVKTRQELPDRLKIIIKMKDKGMSHKEIGELLGVTKARIGQILKKLDKYPQYLNK